jgi:cytochrome c-type biogenesis protein CcmH
MSHGVQASTPAPGVGAAVVAWTPASVLGSLLLLAGLALTTVMALRWPAAEAPDPARAIAEAPTPQARRAALVRFLERQPRDGRGWVLLGMMDLQAERWPSAAAAFERALAASPKVAADPAIWCEYADALGMAQGGSLAGRPTELIQRALALRADHPKALEMAGSAAYERRDFAGAVDYWRQLLPQIAEGTTPRAELEAAIARAQRLAATSLPPSR